MTIQHPPKNPTNNYCNYAAVLASMAAFFVLKDMGISGVQLVLGVIAAYAVPVLLFEALVMKTYANPSTGLTFSRRNAFSLHRLIVKLIGVYGSFLFVGTLYWLFQEYRADNYQPFWEALRVMLPWVFSLAVPYVAFVDRHQQQPEDAYYKFGLLFLGKYTFQSRLELVQHLLGWVVKGFFLPLMYIAMHGNLRHLYGIDWTYPPADFTRFYRVTTDVLYTVDLLAAVAGYAMTFRLFDTHIRSSEPTVAGWFICLICYQPFLTLFMRQYLNYGMNDSIMLLQGNPVLQAIWGSASLLLLLFYTLASINFGCRFSNITHRGVLTAGMYRYTKHPAYVCKNTLWWLIYVPFIPTAGWENALRYTILVAGVSTVYYLRAITEERHLSRDPDYVRYALYMNEHSVFAGLARAFPFLKYRAPRNWEELPKPYMGIK